MNKKIRELRDRATEIGGLIGSINPALILVEIFPGSISNQLHKIDAVIEQLQTLRSDLEKLQDEL